MDNLESIGLTNNLISDISPLSQFVARVQGSLYLSNNRISDLTPLASATQVRELVLRGNEIVNLGPLSGLTQLDRLDLRDNRMTDVSPLTSLLNLRTLELDQNQGRISCAQQGMFTWVTYIYTDLWQDLNGNGVWDFPEESCP
jgi:internalin A